MIKPILSGSQGDWIFHTTYLMLSFVYYYHLSVFCYWICGNKLFYGMMILFLKIYQIKIQMKQIKIVANDHKERKQS